MNVLLLPNNPIQASTLHLVFMTSHSPPICGNFQPFLVVTLMVLKNTGKILGRMSLHLSLSYVFSWLYWDYGFAGERDRGKRPHYLPSVDAWCQTTSLLMETWTMWLRKCLPDSSSVKLLFFSFITPLMRWASPSPAHTQGRGSKIHFWKWIKAFVDPY